MTQGTEYQEYPKWMRHPHAKPATLIVDERYPNGQPKSSHGDPAFMPPIQVHNKLQEEAAAAKGYVPQGTSDPEAYRRHAVGADEPSEYRFQEYPKMMYHAEEEPLVVNDPDEERALGKGWSANPNGPFEGFKNPAAREIARDERARAKEEAAQDEKATTYLEEEIAAAQARLDALRGKRAATTAAPVAANKKKKARVGTRARA